MTLRGRRHRRSCAGRRSGVIRVDCGLGGGRAASGAASGGGIEDLAPVGWHTVTPRLFVRDPKALVEFLEVAFDASCALPEGDAPAEVRIGDSVVMVSSDAVRAATTSVLYVYVKDADSTYDRAIAAGATSIEVPNDLPYGDRRAAVTDRWGNTWQIATRLP